MWTTPALVLGLALAQGQTSELKIENIRATWGLMGPTREAGFSLLPGDLLHVAFDIVGLKPDKTNEVSFSSSLEIRDSAKKVIHPLKQLGVVRYANVLGGTRTQHTVLVDVPLELKPGKYDLKVNVEDPIGKGQTSFNQGFAVREPGFGLVRFQVTHDSGQLVRLPAAAVVGQPVFVNVFVIGYKHAANGPATVKAEMTMLDEQNKPLAAAIGQEFAIPQGNPVWHLQFDLPVNRAGKFKIQLKATDLNDKKTATLTVPFLAVEQK